jgi:hypothetical protein
MRRPTPPRRVNHRLQLCINSRREQNIAERRKILRQSSTTGDQERITMLKKKMTMKKTTMNPPFISRSHPPPAPRRLRSSLRTENEEGPTTEKSMTRANRGLFPSFLKRRSVASKGSTKKKPTHERLRAFTMGKGGGMTDDETEIDTNSYSGITENGVFTRFFGGDDVTSSGSFETTSVLTSDMEDNDDGGIWNSLHCYMCGNCA